MTSQCLLQFFPAQGTFSFFQRFLQAAFDWLEGLHRHVNIDTDIGSGNFRTEDSDRSGRVMCMRVCSCVSAIFMTVHTYSHRSVCVRVCPGMCMASGSVNPGALMSHGGLEMKVEMVMTPEGYRERPLRIAEIPQPLLHTCQHLSFRFSFYHKGDWVLFHPLLNCIPILLLFNQRFHFLYSQTHLNGWKVQPQSLMPFCNCVQE